MVKPNLLDRAVGWVSPAAGARRLRSRAAVEVLTRSYGGASRDRTKHSWRTHSTSANDEIGAAGTLLRDRMRDLVRNNPYAANAVSVLVTHAIGTGIVPRAEDPAVNKLFDEWSKQCDAAGNSDFYGIQSLAAREMFESGDGLVRRRPRYTADGLAVPLQIEVVETDLIDSAKNGELDNGNNAILGIEFNGIGRRAAYWMFAQHPGSALSDIRKSSTSRPIPASEIVHLFEKQRTQVRGTPWGTPAISDLHDLAEYERAELTRKRLEACMVGVVTGGDDGDAVGIQLNDEDGKPLPAGVYDAHGERIEKFEPGMLYNAVGGKDIKFSSPAATGSYDSYKTSMLHTVAAGFRVPHALLSGRLDKINYSSSKIGLEGFKGTISALQWQVIIPLLCEPVWQWFLEAAFAAGKIRHTNHPATWSPPRFYSADPAKDIKARTAEVRAGFKSLPDAIAEGGENPDDVLKAIIKSNAFLDKYGLIFDSDPRRVSQAGLAQMQPDDRDDDEDEDDEADDDNDKDEKDDG